MLLEAIDDLIPTKLLALLGYSSRTIDRACQLGHMAKQVLDERVGPEVRRLRYVVVLCSSRCVGSSRTWWSA